jgi:hypothetical protein
MRIDKKNDATYTKELDEMEKYFLNMFKRFIENDPGFLDKSVESIITEAVKRAKKEIIFEKASGVLSINNMSGVVKLTLDDLNGEPKILTKYSAFNRPFGTDSGTVCEGNDPRLSDARTPMPHNHNDLYYLKSELVTHTEDGHMDKLDKIKLDGIEANANFYIHPIGPGYNHIPAGGTSGQYLKWHSDGEAEWEDVALNKVTETADGIMSKEDKIKLDGIEAKPVGNDGEVYFISGNDSSKVLPSYILCKAAVIESDEELSETKTKIVDFSEVFNSWYRFSHNTTAVQPASSDETQEWQYINGAVECQINSSTYIGFVSKDKYDTYTLEVTVKSTATDNDRIGVVIAFTKDSSGVEHTISALRDMEGSYNWFLVYDYAKSTQQILDYKVQISGDVRTNWSNITNGSRIRVKRTRNIIEVYASPFNSTTIDVNSKMTLDLSTDSKFNIFKGPCSYGYSCQSQEQSTFTDVVFTGDIDRIYDTRNGDVWVKTDTTWAVDSTKNIGEDIGIGKFVFNEFTRKLFYVKDNDNILSLSSTVEIDKAKLDSIECNANNYIHPTDPGYKHIPAGGNPGQVLEWKANGEAEWVSLNNDIVTFETSRIKKRGTITISLAAGVKSSYAEVDISLINFYNAPTYMAYYVNDTGTKEQIPTITFNDLDISEVIKAYISATSFKVSIIRKDASLAKDYKIYFEILDIDNSVTVERAKSIKVLNIYPGVPSDGSTYTFTNWKGETVTLPMTAQVKKWMEEPNDESPKGYGQGLISIECVNIDDFNLNPDNYLKDSSGHYKYDTVYLGAWDSNNGKSYSNNAINAITQYINAGHGYISGHDTPWVSFGSLMGIKEYSNTSSAGFTGNTKITVSKSGFISSFSWNLGDSGTELIVPFSHVSNQFHTGDIWFKYEAPDGFSDVTTVDGVSGTCNFYLGTYNNTAFIQTGHSNGIASSDEQKILANVFYYLANKGV